MAAGAGDEVRTACPYCGVGCGVLAKIGEDGTVAVRGDPKHPANRGSLCSKGTALGLTLGLEGRVLHPEVAGKRASWECALDLVAQKFADAIAAHGPDSVAFYVSGQLLTEDYYVANKLMKGFIGSANIDTNSRLCMSSSVAGHRRAFGEDIVPGVYEDFDEADLVVLVGSNLAWCHPIIHQRVMAARDTRGTKIVVVDPRRTATAEGADLHLALNPGTDVLLFNGLLAHIARTNAFDTAFVDASTTGFHEAMAVAAADAAKIEDVATGCGLPPADIAAFYDLFARTQRTITVYSQGVNQSAHGTDKVNAIINCHLATGRVGKPGGGPFSVTGQPNAMGGREVGGLANQLAAHMSFESASEIARVGRFWNAPNIAQHAGLKAVDMFRAAADGRIKALWIMGTNPAVSMPDAVRVRAALKACEFVAVTDVVRTDTAAFAHVFLPAATWGEKDGVVTNSERRLSRQRSFLPAPGEARPDWRIICDVAARMGFGAAFDYTSPAAIFREHAALSAFENEGERLFDLGAFAHLEDEAYESLPPRLWPAPATGATPVRLLGDGRFPTKDGRARFTPVRQEGPALGRDEAFPLALNSGRLRDQWHTMTRTGAVPRLGAHAPEPAVDLHPHDAAAARINDGDLVRLSTRYGFVRVKARITHEQRPGHAFLPMHWSGRFAANAAAGTLSTPLADAFSGQPELKHVPARVDREQVAWEGLLVSRRDLRPTGLVHWSRRAVNGGWIYLFAGTEKPDEGILLARAFVSGIPASRLMEYTDRRGQRYRAAALDEGGAVTDVLLVAGPGLVPTHEWFLTLLESRRALRKEERLALLSGCPPETAPALGRIVCACFNVGINQLTAAVAAGCVTVEQIGAALSAGTNCGSCRPEIRNIINGPRAHAAE